MIKYIKGNALEPIMDGCKMHFMRKLMVSV